MEAFMSYQHCPECRLTVHLAIGEELGKPCPRCGATLADEPRSLFSRPPSSLSADAVRSVMAVRGGRFRRDRTRTRPTAT
jgi:uncharacterized paraquat-inducible protein A